MRRIAIVNLKGGVGKTTTATALAVGLARQGRAVLFVDCDPSGNGSWTLGAGEGAAPPTLADVLSRTAPAEDAVRPTATPGLDLLPADASLGGVNVALAQELGRDTRLRSRLGPIIDRYDVAVVDTGPTLTTLLINALTFATEVIVPVDAGVYAVLGMTEVERTLAEVRDAYNPGLRMAGIVLTKVARTAVARDVERELRDRFGPLVYQATIPAAVAVESAHGRGLTVLDHAPRSGPALAYKNLAEEIDNGDAANRGRAATGGHPRKAS